MNELKEAVLEREGCPLHYWVGGPTGAPLVVFYSRSLYRSP